MTEFTSEPTTTAVVCTVPGCVGPYDDENSHADENPAFNLHYAAGYEGDLPLDAHGTMDATTEGRWKLYVEVTPVRDELTAEEGLELAQAIATQAERVHALNSAMDGTREPTRVQAWFDAHPNCGRFLISAGAAL